MQNFEDSEHAKTTYQQKPLKLDQCNSGEDTDPIAKCLWLVSTSPGLINLDASADCGSDIDSSDESNNDEDLQTPIAPPVTSLRMDKVIFLAGTVGFWSYERSDTLVRMSVNTSGEKSETLVRSWSFHENQELLATSTFTNSTDKGVWPKSKSFNDRVMGPVPKRWKETYEAKKDFPASSCNKELKFNRENMSKIEDQLKRAFVEFHKKLRLLKSYRQGTLLFFLS
ncbi:hypothetical protein AgCh_013385 [Apium graveolens]